MSGHFKMLPLLRGDQALASDPSAHASLSASAGTGKTQVLTARVLRLLLKGVRPESILCLTFTKAAAAEMANRIGARLAAWVTLTDSELDIDLVHLGESADPLMRERARQLFARVLECPGGLKILTIHSFSQSLLAAFPTEAGIVPGFRPIEGRTEQELVKRTLAELMADSEARGEEGLIRDVQCLSRRLGEGGAIDYLLACARKPQAVSNLGPPAEIEPKIKMLMKLPDSVEEFLVGQCSDDDFDCDLLRAIAEANRIWGKATGLAIVDTIERWLAMDPSRRAQLLPELASIVFTGKIFTSRGELRKAQVGQLKADGDYERHTQRLAGLIAELISVQRGSALAAEIAAGLRAGQAFSNAYTRAKRAAGVADFNDLIEWTRGLLAQDGISDWVRYKLDRRIDHLLVDEAQDTNAAQWDIIERLVEEYFSGSSEIDQRRRTLFMVGDFKQAIYGFQGTDPERFRQAREMFKRRAATLSTSDFATEFRDLSIGTSFRSSQAVLDVVDSMIDHVGSQALGLREPSQPHRAQHRDRQGVVELWAPFKVEELHDDGDEGEERWISLRDRQYAEVLANRIKQIIDEAPWLGSVNRALTPGDILVLVRSRGELASLIVARLFSAGVPVAGVDRLHLHQPLAVKDLLTAMKFAVQPNDDLSLACLLVSPLIGWNQEQLRTLAFGRDASLWRELRRRTTQSVEIGEAHDALAELLRIADFATPAQFLETILSGSMQGRRKLYARLGLAARDAIDELMNSAIEFERNEIASLDRFLSWFSKGTVDVQRDPGQPANEVRVITVHGAKGLEAPVVILADATADPSRLGRVSSTLDVEIEGAGIVPFLRPKRDELGAPFEEVILAEERRGSEEHLRLLYVALTRAADRLVISGVRPKEKKDGSDPRPVNCWHSIVERSMAAIGAAPGGDHVLLRYGPTQTDQSKPVSEPDKRTVHAIPNWAIQAAPPETRPPRPLAPSALVVDDVAAPAPSADMRSAALRGIWIHQLLERLPALELGARPAAADRWLEFYAVVADADVRKKIVTQVCGILAEEGFAPLFGPGSLAEVPLAATLADGRVIAGTVDRLVVEEDRVTVVDFKTGRVPNGEEDIPNAHRAQMSAYSDALQVIFPGRQVRSLLLYTAGPKLIELRA